MNQIDPHANLRAALADGALMLAHEVASGRDGTYHVVNAEGREPKFSCPADEYLAVVPYPHDWAPTSEHINALPKPVRDYVHLLHTNTDPAGTVRENALLRDQVKQLAAQVAELQALAVRAIPFLEEVGSTFDDDGSNEPLELARDIRDAVGAE